MAVLLAPQRAAEAAEPVEQELEDVRGQLDAARQGLDDVEGRQAVTVADLQQVDLRRAALDTRLAALQQELTGAETSLARAEQTLDRTARHLEGTEQRLAGTRAELEAGRAAFDQRVRASYMYGGTDPSALAVEVQDVATFQRGLAYVGTILDGDRRQVETVATLERRVTEQARQLTRLRQEHALVAADAQAERDRVAALVDQERTLKAEADAEAERHRAILAQLQHDEQSHRELVGALEAEGARLEAELRALAEAAARAAAEAAARAAAEARRAGEEAAARRAAQARRRAEPAPARSTRPGAFQSPVNASAGSGFGWRTHPIFGTRRLHTGIDYGAPTGTPIVAADDGVVMSAGNRGGYGNATVIDHGGGIATLYAHQSRFAVAAGASVARGEVIGYVGSTGFSTGPHLHFEVRVDGVPHDPLAYL